MNPIKSLILTLARGYVQCVNEAAQDATDAWEEQRIGSFFGNLLLFALYLSGATLTVIIIVWTLYSYRWRIIRLLAPIGIIWLMVASYRANHPHDKEPQVPADVLDVEVSRQDAEDADEDMTGMMFNAACDVADNTPVIRPRDLYSIQASVDGHIYMDGALAVHRFELRCDREIDRTLLENVTHELQACMNRQSKRFPLLIVDGHAPIIYDIRGNGTFFAVEVVRYSKAHEEQIMLRRRARIARKLKEADAYDCDV